MRFSIVLIAKNEERTLPTLLASIKDFMEAKGEVIFVDTGSTDKTREVAESYGLKVIEAGDVCYRTITQEIADAINIKVVPLDGKLVVEAGDRVFDFAAARNFAASFSSNDWIFQPDCDEVVSWDLAELERQIDERFDSLSNWITAGGQKWRTVRFYNRNRTKWTGITHNSVGRKWVDLDEKTLNLTHKQEVKEDRPKRIKALALGAYLDPKDARRLFYYGRELLWRGFYNVSIGVLEKAAELHWWKPEKAQCHIFIADAKNKIGDVTGMIKSLETAAAVDPERRVGHIGLIRHYANKKNWVKVIEHCRKATAIPYKSSYVENIDDYGEFADIWLCVALYNLGKKDEAKSAFIEALRKFPHSQKLKDDWKFYFPMPSVSVCIPTLGREDKLARLLGLIRENAQWPNYEVIVEHDSFEDRQGVPKTLKKAVEKSKGDFVMFLGNDCQPEPGFMYQAVRRMFIDYPEIDGLIGINDGVFKGDPATHWLASRKLLPNLDGEFFSTEYEHTYCDRELTERCKMMGKYSYEPESKLIHDNPIVKGGEMDEVNKIAANMDRRRRDYATYERRKKTWSSPVKTELCLLAEKYRSDKCPSIFHSYTPKYHELLNPIKDKVNKVLEIGIGTPKTMNHVKGYQAGASLFMWKDYFPKAWIYGIDIRPEATVNAYRITSIICDQSSAEQLETTAKTFGPKFDLIIDDGSHLPEHQITSAKTLVKHLSDFGIYVIEDILDFKPLLKAFADENWDIRTYDLNLAFSKYDRLMVIRNRKIDLPFTGERVVPDKMDAQPQTLAQHLARYKFAQKHVEGAILDAPCGTGYGTAMIGGEGCDISPEAIEYANSNYTGIRYFVSDLENPDFNKRYDTVVSFEGLEHLSDPKPFIEWVRKNSRKFIFSIPVNNPSRFHKQVYSVEQIKSLFTKFGSVSWFSQIGTEITPLDGNGQPPTFLIGIAEV